MRDGMLVTDATIKRREQLQAPILYAEKSMAVGRASEIGKEKMFAWRTIVSPI